MKSGFIVNACVFATHNENDIFIKGIKGFFDSVNVCGF